MAYPAEKKDKYTYEDYLRTPEDKRYELIGGELIMVPAPTTKHQEILVKLTQLFMNYNDENGVGKFYVAPSDVYLDDENVVQPDILFVSKERLEIITEANIKGAPDLVIEILSPSSAYVDLIKKKALYARFGVKEFWVVAPDEKTVETFQLEENAYRTSQGFSEADKLTSNMFPGLLIELKKLFK